MRILVAEDQPTLASQLVDSLQQAGYATDSAADGRDVQHLGLEEPFDLVILDLGLPHLDGLSILRHWRSAGRSMPVLILTARDAWHEKVNGIDAGADDYLTKPFHMEELLARVRALIRRSAGHASAEIHCGALALDTASRRVTLHCQPLTLTAHELRVLEYLMHRPGQPVSRSELIEHIYAQDYDRDSNTIEVFINRLRKKLPPGSIETLRGLGYRLVQADPP